jgi:GAF domain-containing protein
LVLTFQAWNWQTQVAENGNSLLVWLLAAGTVLPWLILYRSHRNNSRSHRADDGPDSPLFRSNTGNGDEHEHALKRIAELISFPGGQALLDEVVLLLAKEFELDYVFVGQLKKEAPHAIQTIAFSASGTLAENFSYELAGTPCEKVIGKGSCVFDQGVQQEFPDDDLLRQMSIEAYMGCPLTDTDGKTVGLLVAMHSEPFGHHLISESVLKILLERVSIELVRQSNMDEMKLLLDQQELINQLQIWVMQTPDPGHLLDEATEKIKQISWLGPNTQIGIYLVDEHEKLVLTYHRDFGADHVDQRQTLPMGEGMCGIAASLRKMQFHHEHHEQQPGDDGESGYAIPLIDGDKLLGVLELRAVNHFEFSENAASFLNILGCVFVSALARKSARDIKLLANKVYDHTREGIIITDARGHILRVNPAFTVLTGYDESEVLGKTSGILSSGRHGPDFYQEMWRTLDLQGYWSEERGDLSGMVDHQQTQRR